MTVYIAIIHIIHYIENLNLKIKFYRVEHTHTDTQTHIHTFSFIYIDESNCISNIVYVST